jgi:CheY-like chemotaxis protein
MKTMPTIDSAAPMPPSDAASGRHHRILYADDMPELRKLMSAVLAREGYEVETVDGGSEALQRLQQEHCGYDLLITDHQMPPGINGLELVRQTRELNFPGKIVVFSSALCDELSAQYRQFAVDAILPKPIFPVTFRRVLEQLFAADHPGTAQTPPVAHA